MNGKNYFYTPNDPNETYQRYERGYDGSLHFRGQPESLRNYAGIGPKNYRRSDELIYEEICEVLTLDPDIDASEIDVKVHKGIATLSGEVETKTLRAYAEESIGHVFGIKEIRNIIKVPEHSRHANWKTQSSRASKHLVNR
ncbi:MAG: BON domain-containing protein [Pseudobdellovibrionaceae bacterium]